MDTVTRQKFKFRKQQIVKTLPVITLNDFFHSGDDLSDMQKRYDLYEDRSKYVNYYDIIVNQEVFDCKVTFLAYTARETFDHRKRILKSEFREFSVSVDQAEYQYSRCRFYEPYCFVHDQNDLTLYDF